MPGIPSTISSLGCENLAITPTSSPHVRGPYPDLRRFSSRPSIARPSRASACCGYAVLPHRLVESSKPNVAQAGTDPAGGRCTRDAGRARMFAQGTHRSDGCVHADHKPRGSLGSGGCLVGHQRSARQQSSRHRVPRRTWSAHPDQHRQGASATSRTHGFDATPRSCFRAVD